MIRVLDPPAEVLEVSARQEVFRAWIDGDALSVSLCNQFPERWGDDLPEIWGALISDIFHHVVDAIHVETNRPRNEIQQALRTTLEEVIRSGRGTQAGTLQKVLERLPEIPAPELKGGEDSFEIIRIALLPGSIRVMALVGMWLPEDEEVVWGNLLYDISSIVAACLAPERDYAVSKSEVLSHLISGIDTPNTNYSGEYYNTEHSSDT